MTQITISASPASMFLASRAPGPEVAAHKEVLFARVLTRRRPSVGRIGLAALGAWMMAPSIYNAFLVFAAA